MPWTEDKIDNWAVLLIGQMDGDLAEAQRHGSTPYCADSWFKCCHQDKLLFPSLAHFRFISFPLLFFLPLLCLVFSPSLLSFPQFFFLPSLQTQIASVHPKKLWLTAYFHPVLTHTNIVSCLSNRHTRLHDISLWCHHGTNTGMLSSATPSSTSSSSGSGRQASDGRQLDFNNSNAICTSPCLCLCVCVQIEARIEDARLL